MNILLLGEYSGFYRNLCDGLRAHKQNVTLASSGDGFKKIDTDIILPVSSGKSLLTKIIFRNKYFNNLKKIKNYDVVQLINPFMIYHKYFPNYYIVDNIIKNNNKFFMSAAGCDAFELQSILQGKLRYTYYYDALKYEWKDSNLIWETPGGFEFNKYIADNCNGIIPVMYEYALAYQEHSKLKKTIPLPINYDTIEYHPNIIKKKIKIFHGLNRYGFKGTHYVADAFEQLKRKYPNDIDTLIEGNMPLNNYLELLKTVNIVIDQTSSYSYGMNAIYAMALGKVVLSGAEPESLIHFGVSETPVINVLPDSQDIIQKVEMILENKKDIEEKGYKSRVFIENTHGYIKIAQKYLECWKSSQ
jgi:hypothetical protein